MKVSDPHDEERRYLTTEFYIVPGHKHADEPPSIFSDKGDSGSMIISSERDAVLGQMFAGSGISEKGVKTDITYFSPGVRIAHAVRILTGNGTAIPAAEGPPQSFVLKQAGKAEPIPDRELPQRVKDKIAARNPEDTKVHVEEEVAGDGGQVGDGAVGKDDGRVAGGKLGVVLGAVGSEVKIGGEVEEAEEKTEKKENTASIEDPDIDFAEFPELLELVNDLLKNGGP